MSGLEGIEEKSPDELIGLAQAAALERLWFYYQEVEHRKKRRIRTNAHEASLWPAWYWVKTLGRNVPPSVQVAIQFVRDVGILNDAHRHNDATRLTEATFWVAYTIHELLAPHSDRSSQIALEAHGRLRAGGRQGANKTNKKHIERQPKYQAEVDRRMDAGANYTEATDQVALSHGVSGRTVRRHTVNHKPHNRGGRRRKTK
jgi:hypothetical protein